MKIRLPFLLFSLIGFPFFASAQTAAAPCIKYFAEGDEALMQGQFRDAILKYNAAAVCDPNLASLSTDKLFDAIDQIIAYRLESERARMEAEKARQIAEVQKRAAEQQGKKQMEINVDVLADIQAKDVAQRKSIEEMQTLLEQIKADLSMLQATPNNADGQILQKLGATILAIDQVLQKKE